MLRKNNMSLLMTIMGCIVVTASIAYMIYYYAEEVISLGYDIVPIPAVLSFALGMLLIGVGELIRQFHYGFGELVLHLKNQNK